MYKYCFKQLKVRIEWEILQTIMFYQAGLICAASEIESLIKWNMTNGHVITARSRSLALVLILNLDVYVYEFNQLISATLLFFFSHKLTRYKSSLSLSLHRLQYSSLSSIERHYSHPSSSSYQRITQPVDFSINLKPAHDDLPRYNRPTEYYRRGGRDAHILSLRRRATTDVSSCQVHFALFRERDRERCLTAQICLNI